MTTEKCVEEPLDLVFVHEAGRGTRCVERRDLYRLDLTDEGHAIAREAADLCLDCGEPLRIWAEGLTLCADCESRAETHGGPRGGAR